MNWLLIAAAVWMIGFAYYGYKKGIVRIIFSFGSLIVALVLSAVLAPYINTVIRENTGIYEAVQAKCEEFLAQNETAEEGPSGLESGQLSENMVQEILNRQEIPQSLKNSIEKMVPDMDGQMVSARAAVADGIAGTVVSSISYMITFLVIRVVLWIILHALDVVSKLPIIHKLNQTAGLLFGLLEGLALIWIFFLIVTCVLQTSFGQSCMKMIAESQVLSFLFDHNILVLFFSLVK